MNSVYDDYINLHEYYAHVVNKLPVGDLLITVMLVKIGENDGFRLDGSKTFGGRATMGHLG